MAQLVPATDLHFAWLLGEASLVGDLQQAPGGVEKRPVLKWLRRMSQRLEAAGHPCTFLIVDAGEVVGLCSFKGPPDPSGIAEIGYGIAESRRRRGYATRAVSLLCDQVRQDGGLKALRAETSPSNPASRRVLESNGFANVDARMDDDDGHLLVWAKAFE
jgi:RimJ/RimL family protein N-acetyltransferase